jgi:chromate transport protein ChrA
MPCCRCCNKRSYRAAGISNDAFLAGYGAAQAVPSPLFTFAAYLGTAMKSAPNGWTGGLICLTAIYLPSSLLLIGALPFWDALRHRTAVQTALKGVNATSCRHSARGALYAGLDECDLHAGGLL